MKNICFQMTRKAWLAMALVLCLTFPALAQKITVTGTVIDTDGEPLMGASVIAEGTSTGVSTDFDGNFRIDVAPSAVLVVSYVGMETQRIPVDGRSHIDVTLNSNDQVLGEVVAIGYGVVKKQDATGSVSVIKPDDIEAGISTSAQELLVGASPGVVVTTSGGDPLGDATIRIRGGASLNASNDPLIVIDGVPQTNQSKAAGNALTMINPQNIESMTILKDASATAIYGSRASNGVIIITTKKGKSGKPQVNFAANFHVSTPRNYQNMMGADEFRSVIEGMVEKGTATETSIAMLGDANTDWQKEVLRTVFSHDYNLAIGGQAGWLPYRVSASYTYAGGILKTSDMQRANVGFNLSPKFFNGELSVNANVNGTYLKNNDADVVVGAAARMNPTLAVMNNYRTIGNSGYTMYNGFNQITLDNGMPNTLASENPLQKLVDRHAVQNVQSSTGNLQVDYAIHWLPELHLNLNLGYEVSKNTRNTTMDPNSVMQWRTSGLTNMGSSGAGTINRWYELQRNTMLEFYLNYRKDFEAIKSNLDVVAGYTWQHQDYHGRSQTYVNTPGFVTNSGVCLFNDGIYTLDIDEASKANIGKPVNNAPMSYWAQHLQLLSFYGRLNYQFDNTYLLTFTLRDDATSRFSKDTRWGLFPAVALGWKINNMRFMEGTSDWLNELKLRLGWGVTGQQDVGSYFPYLPYYTNSHSQGYYYMDPVTGEWLEPLYPEAYDSTIKWEETTTWNVGLDFGFLNNRITVALDWYLRDTKDLLAETIVSGWNTRDKVLTNIGSLRNIGVEATIGAKPVVTKDFTWSTGVNVAWNRNKITALTGNKDTDQILARGVPSGTGGGLQYHLVGEAAYSFLVYQQVYDADGNPVPGQYVDQNADGVIDNSDKIVYHSPDPKITATWNNTFNWRKWDLGFNLRASLGNWCYNNMEYEGSRTYGAVGNQLSNLLANTFYFTAADENLALSDYFVENASYIRCDNITLGYTFDNIRGGDMSLRLFGAVQNPFVITKYKGLDPEQYSGIENSAYPRPTTYSIGLVATF